MEEITKVDDSSNFKKWEISATRNKKSSNEFAKVLTTNVVFCLIFIFKNIPKGITNTKILIDKWAKDPHDVHINIWENVWPK